MKSVNVILDKLISVKNRAKRSGSRAANRFNFQASESMKIIFDRYFDTDNFLAIFDYHEDFILFEEKNNKAQKKYFQIKTSKKNWTVDSLVALDSTKKSSILSKMYEIGIEYAGDELQFVTNKKFSLKMAGELKKRNYEKVVVRDLDKSELTKITAHLKPLGISDLSDLTILRMSDLPVKNSDRETTMKGYVVNFLEKVKPGANYNPYTAFLIISKEVTRKLECEEEFDERDEFLIEKGLSKMQLTDMIESIVGKKSLETSLQPFLNQLNAERVNFKRIKEIRAAINRMNALRIANSHYTEEFQKLFTSIISNTTFVESSLMRQMREVKKNIYLDSVVNSHLKTLEITEKELEALILYEIFKD